MLRLTKTDYLIYRECDKNAWFKIHKPDLYFARPPSKFDLSLLEIGNEIDVLARDLFPEGVLVEGRDDMEYTRTLIKSHTPIIYQPVFATDIYKTACDIMMWNDSAQAYDLYEVKASTSGEDKKAKDDLYAYDLAFQYAVLTELSVPINHLYLIRLDTEYVRGLNLDLEQLFIKEDFTAPVKTILEDVKAGMKNAYDVLSHGGEPFGSCSCLIKGRSAHCTTFSYSNPDVPAYSVHDITRIGMSKKKLADLVDTQILSIYDVPDDFELSDIQRSQVTSAQTNTTTIDREAIQDFLNTLVYPIAFLDYETYPAAIPRFVGYHPFDQIPFQFSLHTLALLGTEPTHSEFITIDPKNPDQSFILALQQLLPDSGSIVVWNKRFEMGINDKLAARNPQAKDFLEQLNNRVVDLEDVFKKQYFIHPGFKGKTSIKSILPVLAPTLSYKALDIQEGATASDTWNKIVTGEYSAQEAQEKATQLKTYCALDTYAMYAIWKYLVVKVGRA